MTPEPMRVDPEHLINIAGRLESAVQDVIPQEPPAFTAGTDPLSTAILAASSEFEERIRTDLPALKAAALKTAQNIGEAGRRYQQADDDMARQIEERTALSGLGGGGAGAAGGAGAGAGAGAGGAGAGAGDGSSAGGAGGGMEQMSQLMSMPMQMASQMAQMPMQAMGALGSLPQSVMQGVQQMAQMGGGKGDKPGQAHDEDEKREAEERRAAEEKAKADEQNKAGAAPAHQGGEKTPVAPAQPAPAEKATPERRHPAHARPADPSINV